MSSHVIAGLERHATQRAEQVAVVDRDGEGGLRSFDWRSLHATATELALRLERVASGSPVLVCGGNQFEVLAAILAGLHADLPVAPVAPESTASELRSLAAEIGARVVVGAPEALERLHGAVPEHIPLSEVQADVGDGTATGATPRGRGDGSILLRSSGTTGPPKVVRRAAAALDAVGDGCRAVIGVDERDRMLLVVPVYHSYGIDMAVLTGVPAGACLELHARFDVQAVRTALAERGISCFPAVPLMLDSLARGSEKGTAAPALRRVVSAGSPLPPEVAERFRAAFGVAVGQVYGATEFGSVAYNAPEAWDPARGPFRPECVGRPLPGVEIRIVEGDDLARALPAGTEGQVAVASPSMLTEYLGDDAPPTRDGFLLTGDLGRLDESGVLELTGRLKLMIDVGGLKVNPLEVEAVLVRHPAVRDAVAVPIYYSETASRLKAIVIPEPGAELTRDEIRRFAREHLIHYKVPRSFEIRSDVPRSPTGKILRQKLILDAAGTGK